jgi:predicted peptidase
MLLTWARIAAIYTLVSLSPAQTSGGRAEVKLFEATLPHTTRIQYLLQLPGEYDARRDRAWPLLVYLHGASGRGSDLELVKRYGPPATAGKVNAFPFVLISPQCPEGEIWTDTEGLIAMIASVQKQYRVDPRRIYLTGISMGGRGVLYLAYKHPATFAAVASLAPYAPIEDTKELADTITKAGGTVEFRPLPGRDHYIADLYSKGDIYDWLLKHQR